MFRQVRNLAVFLGLVCAYPNAFAGEGNDHGSGDPTIDPLEEIFPEAAEMAKDRLLEFAKHNPIAANSMLDTFKVCKFFKSTTNHTRAGITP